MGINCSAERKPTKSKLEKIMEIRQNANKNYITRLNKYDKSIHGDYFDYLLKIEYQYEKEVDYSHITNKNQTRNHVKPKIML